MAAVNIRDYVRELGKTLLDTLHNNGEQIELSYQVADVYLDIDTAIPLGLIINELVTNSLKYAFTPHQTGKIEVDLFINDEQHLVLRVADEHYGGLMMGAKPNGTGFGSKLVKILSKKLKGTPIIQQRANGYQTEIVFQRWSEGKVFSIMT